MRINILTLFPEMFDSLLSNSIIKRAISKKVVSFNVVNIRDYTKDKYGRVDSAPIGGGAGLIMKCQPILDALKNTKTENEKVILLSARGKTFNQKKAVELANENKDLIFICGHYEGVDERVNDYVDELISIGDFILTGGELPAMLISDAVVRLLDGAINKESIKEESFNNNLLEYPQYTEPYDYNGKKVPDILYSGNHEAIFKYRQKQSLELTRTLRPDLFEKYNLTKQDKKLLDEIDNKINEPKWLVDALNKGKKFIK